MSPRKSTKAAEPQVNPQPEAAPKPKPRAKRATAVVEAPAPAPVAEAPAPAADPKPRTKRPAKKEAPAPAPEVVASPAPVSVPEPFDAVERMTEAIRTGRAVELIFKDADANPPRTFEPRQLILDVFTQAWFMWGWDRRYNAERHHRLDAMAEINLVDGPGRAAQGPFPEGTPANQIGGWRGGEPIPVKALLFKQWIFAVRQAPAPFPDFRIEELEDGKAQVSFTATDLRAIARWCMQFGDGIQVQEPARLLDRIKQVATAWGAKLAPPPPAPKPQPAPRPEPAPRQESRPAPPPRVREPRENREPRKTEESEAKAQPKNSRIEIRIDRL